MTDFPEPEGAVGSFANRCIINRSTKLVDISIGQVATTQDPCHYSIDLTQSSIGGVE